MNHEQYKPTHKIRIVTAASLFDGHDAAINVMRRVLQSTGGEIIHLGHHRSVQEIVDTAIQEDAQAVAVTSYQGGHMEYFKYMYDLLQERGCGHIKIFGGGGGTILPHEQQALHDYGIARLYSPDDGRAMGLQGMINDLLSQADFPTGTLGDRWQSMLDGALGTSEKDQSMALGQLISALENGDSASKPILNAVENVLSHKTAPPVLGITGTGGAGKSSLVDELVRRFLMDFREKRIAIATRQANLALSSHIPNVLNLLKAVGFDLIILETSGIGQSDTEIVDISDAALYVMTPEYGAASQLEKIDMIDFADVIALNKFDKRGALDALRDIKKQYKRNRNLWEVANDMLPIYGTMGSQFNDIGTNNLYCRIMEIVSQKSGAALQPGPHFREGVSEKISIIPPKRVRYLSEIAETLRAYDEKVAQQTTVANQLYGIQQTIHISENGLHEQLTPLYEKVSLDLERANQQIIDQWADRVERYQCDEYIYQVRGRDISVPTHISTLSHNRIPRVSLPKYSAWGDILRWHLKENVPGEFPFTAGVFPFKRQGEAPTRMFAGEGGPERTNRRFHYVSLGLPAKRLSTAFDSVTLYGSDPDHRPDIYGKVGNSGVSIATLDDAKRLYSGFNLCDPATSVSMTINGPAAIILAFFMNAAIDQQSELYIREQKLEPLVEAKLQELYDDKGLSRPVYEGELPEGNDGLGLMLLGITGDQVLPPEIYATIKAKTLSTVRGTVQADILKEDQAQNTCIFSTEFSLRLMGDVQQYFIDHNVRNFYSVSISGYHIAEAGANPISQLAFTLANGFTLLEYYHARGMNIDKFAPNFSFFFSNGEDPEYAVIGRVARRIWSKALKFKYGAGERAQKLKYHIQTSGRSLHAQEIGFNDIRTTLQALYAIYDNCNSLHTNAYDEAITTPTEESVRRAMAIQLIINEELGLAKNENPMQGSFIIEELTDLVEEAVLMEFDRITERGGVLGAMETMYQRGKIQEESLHYEHLKHSGEMPIIGVNTFLSEDGSPTVLPREVIRATTDEKEEQISRIERLRSWKPDVASQELNELQSIAVQNGNLFAGFMEAVKVCSLGQISDTLYGVGGQYRRNM